MAIDQETTEASGAGHWISQATYTVASRRPRRPYSFRRSDPLLVQLLAERGRRFLSVDR